MKRPKLGPAARDGGWVTIGEAARILGFEPHVVRHLLDDGLLPGLRLRAGSPWRMRRSDLEKWIEEKIRSTRPIRRNRAELDGKLQKKEAEK